MTEILQRGGTPFTLKAVGFNHRVDKMLSLILPTAPTLKKAEASLLSKRVYSIYGFSHSLGQRPQFKDNSPCSLSFVLTAPNTSTVHISFHCRINTVLSWIDRHLYHNTLRYE